MTLDELTKRSDVAHAHFTKKDLSTLSSMVVLQYHAGDGLANDHVRTTVQKLITSYALAHGMTTDWTYQDKPMFRMEQIEGEWFRIDATVGSVIVE